jgi:hypothetical protein
MGFAIPFVEEFSDFFPFGGGQDDAGAGSTQLPYLLEALLKQLKAAFGTGSFLPSLFTRQTQLSQRGFLCNAQMPADFLLKAFRDELFRLGGGTCLFDFHVERLTSEFPEEFPEADELTGLNVQALQAGRFWK